jgi:hypothetical protein
MGDQSMNTNDEEPIRRLLKEALPRVHNIELAHDLWPEMMRRLNQGRTASWFDWALAGGLALFAIVFPAVIPVFLYYL